MPSFVLVAYLCVHFAAGARPGRDGIDDGRLALELRDEASDAEGSGPSAAEERTRTALRSGEVGSGSEEFQECPQLKVQLEELGISGEGDPCTWTGITCSSLEKCAVARIVFRGRETASFNVASLSNMTTIEDLRLDDTRVTGDVAAFKELKKLRRLDLDNTKVSGDIAAFKELKKLQSLYLSNTKVSGDVAAFKELKDLQGLYLMNTKVSGDVAAFKELKDLQSLYLDNTKVSGDVAAFKELEKLQRLYLDNTKVSGDVAAFKELKDLQGLDLDNTKMGGDVAAFKELKDLQWLDLDNTKVSGDVAAFKELKKLQKLSLSNTKVSGDVAAFKDLKDLKKLYLSNTKVSGGIAAFKELKKLQKLFLQNAKVTGDIDVFIHLDAMEQLNLAQTGVSGWIIPATWNGCCQNLREMNLADTAIGPLPSAGVPEFFTDRPLLPALQSLNVSGCQLNGALEDLLLPLADTALSVLLASHAGLDGAMPNLAVMRAAKDQVIYQNWWSSKLAGSLQVMDLSSNRLSTVSFLPASVRVVISDNTVPLAVAASVLQKAVQLDIEVWLRGTRLNNPEELQQLLPYELLLQNQFAASDGGTFTCRELANPLLQVTPQLFMPEAMCGCRPGYKGVATRCAPCAENTYSTEPNLTSCHHCPEHSTSPSGSASWQACRCKFGDTYGDPKHRLSCQCPASEALLDTEPGPAQCGPCVKLGLLCPKAGTNASSAQVMPGHSRVGQQVFKCLDSARCKPSGCDKGYQGSLCADCSPGHRATDKMCKPCVDVQSISVERIAVMAFYTACVLALLGAAMWMMRRRMGSEPLALRWRCAAALVVPQLAILLQLVQMWSVLGRLGRQPLEEDFDLTNATQVENDDTQGDVLLSYLETLQFTSGQLQGFFALQCFFHGASVRLMFAIATPVAPLLLLLCCCLVDVFSRGTGIQVGLKILTVLFIGGASGTAKLLGCQRVDGTGKAALKGWAFRPSVPHLLCTEATWVDWIGCTCATFYGGIIPCFLAFLFAKQHVTMRQSKIFSVHAHRVPKEVTLQLQVISNEECLKEDAKKKRLAAAAAAYVAVHVKGRAVVSLKDADAVTIRSQNGENMRGDDSGDGFSVDDLVKGEDDAAVLRNRASMLRHNAMVQMLAERSVLADIQSKRSDRIMVGAQQLLCKYVSCGFVWLEVCSKLSSAALVSVVASSDGLWLSVAITLGMALVVGIAQPFMQPQVNALQSFCFVCLAMAALGFRDPNFGWLSRAALALPVLLLALQLLRPDSQEALALRLQEELEEKLPAGPVEVSAEQVRFL